MNTGRSNVFSRVMQAATPSAIRTNIDWFMMKRRQYAVSFAEVAEALGVTVATIHQYCREGKLVKCVETGFVTRRSWDAFCDNRLRAVGPSDVLDSGESHGRLAGRANGKYSRGSVTAACQPHKLEVGGSTPSPATSVPTEADNNSARGRYLRCAAPSGATRAIFENGGQIT